MGHGGNHKRQAGTPRRCFPGIVMLSLLVASPLAVAQSEAGTEQTESQVAPPPPPVVEPIPATDIPARAEASQAAFRSYRGRTDPSAEVRQVIAQIDGAEAEIGTSAQIRLAQNAEELPARGLRNLQLQWTNTRNTLNGWQNVLGRQSATLNQARADLAALVAPWRKTREQWDEVQLPAALRDQVTSVLRNAEEVDQELKERLDEILTEQSRVSQLTNYAEAFLSRIRQADALQRQRLLKIDAEPLLTAIFGKQDEDEDEGPAEDADEDSLDLAAEQLESEVSTPFAAAWTSILHYLGGNLDRVAAHSVLFLVLTILLFYTRTRLHTWYREDEEPSADTLNLFAYPVATAAFIALLFSGAMYPAAPLELIQLNRGLLALPLLALVTAALDQRRRVGAYALIAVYVIDSITESIATAPLAGRLLQLLVATLGLLTLMRAEFGTRTSVSGMRRTWHLASRLVIRAGTVALIVAIIANFTGIVALAYLLTDATLNVLYVGLGIFAAALLARGLLDVFLRSPLTAGFRSLRSAREQIRRHFSRVLDVAGILLWLWAALRIFGILDPISDAFGAFIAQEFAIGNFAISLGDLLAFGIALYLGVLVSRFLRYVLEEDFYPRMRLPRGVPSTISMMVNYGVITIAFLIALAAAGFELGRLAIVAGALSVGIGFGLQAIVNNFVAGLILAFERPVQVGDTIEVGSLLGRVTRIGVRASTLRTYDGSEVIVPNSEFISGQVVNWTLSDVTKRQHVPVGVAYGSDPEQVIRLLVDVAKNNPLVLPAPEPFVIFKGFGDSSLDFELRAWCAFNDGLTVLTQLNVGINRTLAENGIEIPFPQRDLHLRTVDSEAGSALAGAASSPGGRLDATKPAEATGSPGELPRYPAESEGSEGA